MTIRALVRKTLLVCVAGLLVPTIMFITHDDLLLENLRFVNNININITNSQASTSFIEYQQHGFSDTELEYFRNTTHIFYNRIPKCGSSTTEHVFKLVRRKNHFKFHQYRKFPQWPVWHFTSKKEEKEFMHWFHSCKGRCLSDAHQHYIHFDGMNDTREQDLPLQTSGHVTYINLVREPLFHRMSDYYFFRFAHRRPMTDEQRKMTFDECVTLRHSDCMNTSVLYFFVPFFCGQEDMCRQPGPSSMYRAMRNVKERYAVVGYLENIEQFFRALEWVFPSWFRGASAQYSILRRKNAQVKMRNKNTNYTLSKPNEDLYKKLLKEEYEFYHFIKQHFHMRFDEILTQKQNVTLGSIK